MARIPSNVKTISMTPYELFKLQVQGVYEAYRRQDSNYIPPNMGGISGQRTALQTESVISVISIGTK